MIYFVSTLKVQLLIWTLVYGSENSDSIKGRLPDLSVISSFLEQFLKPYIQSVKHNNFSPFRAREETAVDKAIRKKIEGLKPYLNDEEDDEKTVRASLNETDDNLALEGNDETTIIEFVPKANMKPEIKTYKSKILPKQNTTNTTNEHKDSFRRNIQKYKELRETIKRLLDKEGAESKTKKVITQTLDDMLSQMVERQCTWKPPDKAKLQSPVFRAQKDTHKSLAKLHKLSNQEWNNLRKQYTNFLKFRKHHDDSFMTQFHDFFENMMNDTWFLASNYKIKCQLVKREEDTPQQIVLRQDPTLDKNQCNRFKICSGELKEFLTNFYKYVNDTAVSTFRNYAAMYIRDVNVDFGLDKDIVVTVIENLSNTVEKKVSSLFRKELDKFKLDDNKKKDENIQHINDFLSGVIERSKKALKRSLDRELATMKTKLFVTVKDDLNVNLRVDLDNLQKLFVDRICTVFQLCNGKSSGRRQHGPFSYKTKDTNNIYVKVQLTLDEELKDSIAATGALVQSWNGTDLTHRVLENLHQQARKFLGLNVTRTTISSTATTLGNITKTTSKPTKKKKFNQWKVKRPNRYFNFL
ncbi:unnamed protein product [Chrysodeixis includens]|uniref:Uncharacterized protein n=1 Tax=Chrysodeixis includens TaxID=689277 RepID=A0A9N8KYG5_CHRIL|nr:unnamed protein product [Chrysodeixis includens]